MTTFTTIPYHKVIEKSKRQDKIVKWIMFGMGATGLGIVSLLLYKKRSDLELSFDTIFSKALNAKEKLFLKITQW